MPTDFVKLIHYLVTEGSADTTRIVSLIVMCVVVWLLSKQATALAQVNAQLHRIDLKFENLNGKLTSFDAWREAHNKQDDEREESTRMMFREIRRDLHAMPER